MNYQSISHWGMHPVNDISIKVLLKRLRELILILRSVSKEGRPQTDAPPNITKT